MMVRPMPEYSNSGNDHTQAWVKINAPVDLGLEALISALSAFPKLQTFESCEGDEDTPAWVGFYYGPDCGLDQDPDQHPDQDPEWHGLAEFALGFLGPGLVQEVGDSASVSVRIDDFGIAMGEISVRPGMIPDVTRALVTLYRGWSCHGGRSRQIALKLLKT